MIYLRQIAPVVSLRT
uniref:Uncharacterized protein n=1 Tax=Rhizophora mucronata TaxID=61149 RepID=A0A2P2QXW4_RHIMU